MFKIGDKAILVSFDGWQKPFPFYKEVEEGQQVKVISVDSMLTTTDTVIVQLDGGKFNGMIQVAPIQNLERLDEATLQ